MATSLANRRAPMPVIVMGAHIAALGTLRVLARHGIPVSVIDETDDVITRSRWYRPTDVRLPETADPDELAAVLRRLDLPEAVLIPCSDRWTQATAGLPDDLRTRFHASLSSPETIASFVDKARFASLTERLDVPRPRTIRVTGPADLERMAEVPDVTSWFLKPTESQRHNRRFGTKGMFVTSASQAAEHVRLASDAGITFLLQEWIPGDPGQTVLIDGFLDRQGTWRALIARRRVRMYPERLANTCCGVTIPLAEVADAVDTLRSVLDAVSYRGMFNAEFKFDARLGRHRFIELNPRPFWFIAQIADVGIDLARMAYLDAQGLPVPTVRSYRLGRHSIYEFVDAKAIGSAWSRGRSPGGSVLRSWLGGDRALFWWSDPRPAAHGLRLAIQRAGIDRAARAAATARPVAGEPVES